MNDETKSEKSEKPEQTERPRPQRPPAAQADGDKTYIVKMKHGGYVGAGCPDKDSRSDTDAKIYAGFDYDHEHPARPGECVYLGRGKEAERRATKMIGQGVAELVKG